MNDGIAQLDSWGNPRTPGDSNLAARFMEELLNLSEDASPIPLGAAVILMPPVDEPDPEQTATKLRMADELVAEGRTVILWTVGKEPPYTALSEMAPVSTTANS